MWHCKPFVEANIKTNRNTTQRNNEDGEAIIEWDLCFFYNFLRYSRNFHFLTSNNFCPTATSTFYTIYLIYFLIHSTINDFIWWYHSRWLLCNDDLSNWTLIPSVLIYFYIDPRFCFLIRLRWQLNVNWLFRQGVFKLILNILFLYFIGKNYRKICISTRAESLRKIKLFISKLRWKCNSEERCRVFSLLCWRAHETCLKIE